MILYHFTRPEHLEAILRDGLKASCANEANDMTDGRPVVWLTERDTLVPTLKVRKMFLSRGLLYGPGCSNLFNSTVCLRVVFEGRDRRLKRFLPWLRKHPGGKDPDDALLRESQADDWIYFGDISPDKITLFKHVPRTRGYWILPFHNYWRVTQVDRVFSPDEEAELLAGRAGPPDYLEAMQHRRTT
jgi:hypothetical protein